MSDGSTTGTNPTPTTPAATTSAAPTGGTPTPASIPAPRAGAQDTGFVYTEGPEYLRGKTAAQAAELTAQLYAQNQILQNQLMSNRGMAPQASAPTYPAPYGTPPTVQPQPWQPMPPQRPSQEEWLANPDGAAQKYSDYLSATQINPVMQAQAAQMAQTNRELVKLQRVDEFRRWGPEIDMAINQLAPQPQARTPENITAIVDMVKARHLPELLADERAKFQNELGGVSARPSAGGQPGATTVATGNVDFDKLPPGYRSAIQRLNVDAKTIDEFLYRTYVKSGMEPDIDKARDRWVAQVNRGDVFSDNKELVSGVY